MNHLFFDVLPHLQDGVYVHLHDIFYGFEYPQAWDRARLQARSPGDDVLVVAREHGRGATSGATVSARNYNVITLRDGKILRYREFYDEASALEAVGLKE